nr:hypothetical protein [Tanacetum cinerariifolium]
MIVIKIESFIIQKRIIRTSSGTATTLLFNIETKSLILKRRIIKLIKKNVGLLQERVTILVGNRRWGKRLDLRIRRRVGLPLIEFFSQEDKSHSLLLPDVSLDSLGIGTRNRATIKTLVIIFIHKIHRVFHNNIFAMQTVVDLMKVFSVNRRIKTSMSLIFAITLAWFNSFCYDDDDDYDYEESTIPLNEIVSQIPPSIVITTSPPVLPIEDPDDSLIMRNEELSTIPEKESDEFIKSSVEDLVPILSESKDTSGSDSEYDLSSCDDFSPIDIPEGNP